jgi:peptide deformylase
LWKEKLVVIIINDEKKLRTKCEDVLIGEVDNLVSVLEAELELSGKYGNSGVGLAAPQIGIYKNISIIRFDNYKLNLVNCRIAKKYDEFVFKGEGCLSFPGATYNTKRFNEVYITDNLVYPNSFIATGFLAVVCQHEIDHLNGRLFMDSSIKEPIVSPNIKVGPNEMCVCGSLKKFKKCCGKP